MNGKEYLEAIKEGQRKFDEAVASLVEKLCESYDTERKVKISKPTITEVFAREAAKQYDINEGELLSKVKFIEGKSNDK